MKKKFYKIFPIFSFLAGELCSAALLIGFVYLKFSDVLHRKTSIIYAGDTSDITYAGYSFIARSLKSGIFPLWDPHIFGGIPLFGYPQLGLFYPLNILFWLLPYGGGAFPYTAYQYLVIFHIFLAGWFMYILGRVLGFTRIIAVIMGIMYMFSPNILIYLGWGNQLVSFPWFPLVLAFLYLTISQKKYIFSILSGITLGILILASPSQPAIQGLTLVGFSLITHFIYVIFVDKKNIKETLVFSLWIHLTTMFVGILIGSVALLPVLEFMPRSIRFLGVDGNVIGKEKIPFHAFLTFRSTFEQLKGFLYTQFANTPLAYNFYGVLPFVAAVIASITKIKKHFFVFFLTILSIFSFLYSIGFLFPQIFYNLPFLNLIREPNKYLFFISLTMPILAAYGIKYVYEEFFSKKLDSKKNYTLFLSLLMVIGFISVIILPHYNLSLLPFRYIYVVVCAAILMTWLLSWKYSKYLIFISQIALLMFIYIDISQFVIATHTDDYFNMNGYVFTQDRLAPLKSPPNDHTRVAGVEAAQWPYAFNAGDMVGFYDVFGYGSPLYYKLMEYRSRNNYCQKFYDLMNVKYFVTFADSDNRITSCNGKIIPAFKIDRVDHIKYNSVPVNVSDTVNIYENKGRKGYAWAVTQVVNAGNHDLIEMMDKKVNINTQALLEKNDFQEISSYLQNSTKLPQYNTKIISDTPNNIKLSVSTNASALLVTSDLYYPGWNVYVNNKKQKIYEVDDLLRGVLIPQGKSNVEYRLEPQSLYTGFILIILTIILSILDILFVAFVRNKKAILIANIIFGIAVLLMLIYFLKVIPEIQNIILSRTI